MKLKSLLFICMLLCGYCDSYALSYIVKLKNNPQNVNLLFDSKQQINFKKVFNFNNSTEKLEKVLSSKAIRHFEELNKFYTVEINSDSILDAIKYNPAVESIQENHIFHVDGFETDNTSTVLSYKEQQWNLNSINAYKAWNLAVGRNIVIGLVDSGVDITHPDFKNQLYINSAEDINHNGVFDNWPSTEVRNGVSGDLDGIDEDGNGVVDDVCGYNFVDSDYQALGNSQGRDPLINDDYGHGTSVAGVMCANNPSGITGIAYGAKIMPLKAIDLQGNGEADDIAAAIVYGVLNGVNVLNMSFGESFDSEIIHEAVKFAEANSVFIAASSGNNNSSKPHFPSDYEEVCSVGASTKDNQKWSLSNYGNNLDIMAPGASVFTTKWNNSYGEVSGTSIAAPQISAVAALLLEKNKNLSPQQIKDILKSSAKDIEDSGWDLKSGSGLVDAYAALQYNGNPELTISSPVKYYIYETKTSKTVPLVANIAVPLFNSYSVLLGEGLYPTVWDTLATNKTVQVINDTILNIDISNLKTSYYTVSIEVNQKDGLKIMKRVSFAVSAVNNILQFETFNVLYPVVENHKAVLISAQSTVDSRMYVKYKVEDSDDDYSVMSETDRYSAYHTLLINDEILPNTLYNAVAYLEASNGEICEYDFEFKLPETAFREDVLKIKQYSLPPTAILNKVAVNGNDTLFAMNELNGPFWKNTKVMKFNNGQFAACDSNSDLNNYNIPIDLGVSDSKVLFLTTIGRTAYLYSQNQNNKFFNHPIFDSKQFNFAPSGLADVDHDGKLEIIGFSDTAFHCLKLINSEYKEIARTVPLDNDKKYLSTDPGFAVGDFDGDGNQDICFMNYRGNILIYSFINNEFKFKYIDSSDYTSNNVYFATPDVDGDGRPEILIGFPGDYELFGEELGIENIWQYLLLKYTANDKYEIVWREAVYPVRAGSTGAGYYYKNGLAAGNIDGQPGDEILLTPYPSLYIYKWDKSKNTMVPFLRYNGIFSNSSLVYDFDRNGINEFSLNTGNQTQFFEFDSTVKAESPTNLTAVSLDSSKVMLKWYKVNSSSPENISYKIMIKSGDLSSSDKFKAIAETDTNSLIVDNLANNNYYSFAVVSIDKKLSCESKLSDSVCTFVHSAIEYKKLKCDSSRIELTFTGKLSDKVYSPYSFILEDTVSKNSIYPVSAIKSSDSTLLVCFGNEIKSGKYYVAFSKLKDYFGSVIKDSAIYFEINSGVVCLNNLYLKSLNVLDKKTLILTFSAGIEKTSASDINNYKIEPIGKITNVETLDNNADKVKIKLDPESGIGAFGKVYTLYVYNVGDLNGNKMTAGPGNTMSFVFIGDDINKAFVYPNPIKYKSVDKAVFAGLPDKCRIEIYNLDFRLINTIESGKANGGIEWDCLDKNGKKLETGIYLFKVVKINNDGSEIESDLIKFAIVN